MTPDDTMTFKDGLDDTMTFNDGLSLYYKLIG